VKLDSAPGPAAPAFQHPEGQSRKSGLGPRFSALPFRNFFKRHPKVFLGVLFVFVLLALLVIFAPKPILSEGISFSQRYEDRQGQLLRLTLSQDQTYRIQTPLDQLSPILIEATLLHEDRYFKQHPGANPIALGKALLNEITGGQRRFGASTLSMQLARMRFHLNTRSWTGKLLQIVRALQIERHYNKNEILEAYLNLVPYGGNVEGAGAASLIYYGKKPADLTLAEALTLAVIPQSPSRRTPRPAALSSNRHLLEARSALFQKWIEQHPSDSEKEATLDMALQIQTPKNLPFLAPHFVEQLMAAAPSPGAVSTVKTTLDLPMQQLLERQTGQFITQRKNLGVQNASALLVDTETMEVLASMGSADYRSAAIDGQVNGITMRRSPGSTLKPLVYALALDEGLIQPHSLLKDTPASFSGYNPENFDRDFAGPIQANRALLQSRNVPAVTLASQLKKRTLYQLLQSAEIPLQPESHYGLTLALGSAEISPEHLATLYATLANHGLFQNLRRTFPGSIQPISRRLLSPEASFLVLDILKDGPRPNSLRHEGQFNTRAPVAWKTGTSWSFRDAWSVAVFDHYVLVVWVGNFNGQTNAAFIGRQTAAPLLFSMIDAIRASKRTALVQPSWLDPKGLNLAEVKICSICGDLASPYCAQTVSAWFIPGISPITPCKIHQPIYVDRQTGLRVPPGGNPQNVKKEIYEVWPSDLLALFKQAGLPRRSPPPWARDSITQSGQPPRILSPRSGITYSAALNSSETAIPLMAGVDADARQVYWFADASFLGSSPPNEPLSWQAPPGTHQLTATDDRGRSASIPLTVTSAP
jgi:penicillin-binding protein 1C